VLVRLLFDVASVLLTTLLVWLLTTHAIRCVAEGRPLHLPSRLRQPAWLTSSFVFLCQELGALLVLAMFWPFPGRRLSAVSSGGERVPVVLIPGYGLHRGAVWFLSRWLRQKGWVAVVVPTGAARSMSRSSRRALDLDEDGEATASLELLAALLDETVDRVRSATGAARVTLIGQGLGGIVARYYIERLGHGSSIDRLITLGTAHGGTGLAVFGTGAMEALIPGSPLLGALEASVASAPVPYISISAEIDACIVPARASALPWPHRNVYIDRVGHHALVFSGKAFQRIRALLLEPVISPADASPEPAAGARGAEDGPAGARGAEDGPAGARGAEDGPAGARGAEDGPAAGGSSPASEAGQGVDTTLEDVSHPDVDPVDNQ
jgi:pimeloyl-ACP methyl ester carboxylesterase